jgi:hypothetical protein
MEIALDFGRHRRRRGASSPFPDLRAEVDHARSGVEVSVILELHGQVRIVDVFDPTAARSTHGEVEPPKDRRPGAGPLPFLGTDTPSTKPATGRKPASRST